MYVKYFAKDWPSKGYDYGITVTSYRGGIRYRLNECQWMVPGTVDPRDD